MRLRLSLISAAGTILLAACAAPPPTDGPAVHGGAAKAGPDYWLDRAAVEIKALESKKAIEALDRASVLTLDARQTQLLADLYEDVQENARAADAARRLVGMEAARGRPSAWILYADAAAYAGRRREAADAIAKTFELEPSLKDLDLGAYLALYLEDYRLSLAASDRYVRRDPGDVWHWMQRTKAAIGGRDRAAAEKSLAAVDRLLAGPGAEALSGYRRLKEHDEYERVRWIVSWAPSRPAADEEAWMGAARAALRERESRALARVEMAAADDPALLPSAAMLYSAIGDSERAAAVLGRIGASDSTDFDLWVEIAKSRTKAGDRAGALAAAGRCAELAGDRRAFRARVAALYADLKDCRAVGLYRSLASSDAKIPGDLLDLARAAVQCGDRAAALDAATRALSPAEADPSVRRSVAGIFEDLNDCRAVGLYRALLAAGERNPGDLMGLARSAARCGDRAALDAAARSAATSGDRDVLRRIAVAYQEAGAFKESLAVDDRLLVLFPKDAAVWSDKGVVQFLSGSSSDSARSLETALRLDPGLARAYLTLGTVYSAEKLYDEALRVYERVPPAADAEILREAAQARLSIEKSRAKNR